MVLVCLFHGAGAGVGTLCHFSTVSFRQVELKTLQEKRKKNIVHPVGFE
jgi:hypothetical protein